MFSEEHLRNRVNKVITSMSEAKLDALVILDDDHWAGGGNVRYLTNCYPLFTRQPMAMVITPQDTTLCVIPGLANSGVVAAKQQCRWVNVVGSRLGLWGACFGKDIKNALDKAKIRGGKVGIDGLGVMSESLSKSIREELKDIHLNEQTGIIERIRMIKDPSEVKAIREAVRLADIGITTFMNSIESGEPQYIAVSKSENASKIAGAEAVLVFMGVGAPWIWGQYPGSRYYKDGDMISVEYNARFQGYWGQVNRTCVIGKLSDKQKHIYQLAFDSYKAIESAVRPGVTCSELYKIGAEVIAKDGFRKPPRQGHGMGLTIAEGYEIDENDHTALNRGYYTMVHTMVTIPEEGVCASIGNPLLVTDKSHEALSKAEYRMQI
jgi:Xaa-Pro aminopeptidase